MDVKTLNLIHAENRHQAQEESTLKNQILRMNDPAKKMTVWRKHFVPLAKPDDSYLLGNIF